MENKRYLPQKLNKRAIQLRTRKRNSICRNDVTHTELRKKYKRNANMQKIRHMQNSCTELKQKRMKAEKEKGKSCTETKQQRCKIEKELLQKSHAHRIDKCCGKKEGLGGCIYIYNAQNLIK